ncbi:MAG: glycosyltransferase family 10 [Candidatus Babeliales bacterium]|nr:glycosyltransferase family 10 [Candidatus Babeliales bacterium]
MKKPIVLFILFYLGSISSNAKMQNNTQHNNKKFIIVVASYKNKYWYQRNLDSIFMQDYDNYEVLYYDDMSPDKTGELVEKYVKERKQEHRCKVIRNTERAGCPLANHYKAIMQCAPTDIIVCVDGDDSLANNNVLTYLNNVYQDPNVWVTYGQFSAYPRNQVGWAAQVKQEVIDTNRFRDTDWVTTHLKTFYAGLFQQIKKEDLLFEDKFFPMAGDLAFMFPLMEMAGNHSKFIPEVLYIYNMANPLNEDKLNRLYQIRMCTLIRERRKYLPVASPFGVTHTSNNLPIAPQDDGLRKIYIKAGVGGRLFDVDNPIANRDDCLQPTYQLQQAFKNLGWEIKQTDSLENLNDAKYIVSLDVHLEELSNLYNYPNAKLILFLVEPPTVSPTNYNKAFHERFSRVYTWKDDLVDNKKYFKYHYPVMNPMIENIIDFDNKKLCTMIAFNKRSNYGNELYSERINVINFFENFNNNFDFYGPGWNANVFKNYKGTVTSKTECLKNYKFSFCFENTKDIKGYVTEKIFDCFRAGCVPIYWGASNITNYVPKNCFIAREDFKNYYDLYQFMKNMSKEEYQKYIINIKEFLNSEKAKLFSIENYIKLFKDLCLIKE